MSEFKPFLALEASAGSGKTFALSVRFIALILMGAKINEILALTFTKKASNEMKKRVIETFLSFEKEEKKAECEQLCKFLGKSKNELLALREARKQEFLQQDLKIYTFDAFFGRILRGFALNLGLMSDFKSSENELDIKAVFLKKLKENALKDLAEYIFELDEKENFFKELENLYQNAYFQKRQQYKKPSQAKLRERYEDLRTHCLGLNVENLGLNKRDSTNLKNNLNSSFKRQDLNLKDFLKSTLLENKCEKQYVKNFEEKDLEFKAKKEAFLEALNAYALELESFRIAKLMEWLEYFSKAKDHIHKEKNTLSFTDISKKVLELIQSEFKDMIYFRLDGYISHLLIDEFQDTNVVQYQILKPLIAELVSGEGTKKFRTFFYVGDKKQSIYRFRKGKKELFELLKHDFTQIKSDSLDTNFRSKENLVHFVNETFKHKFANYTLQKVPNENAKKGGFVRIVSSKEEDAKDIKKKTLEALLEQIKFLKEKNAKDLCILCWKNDDCDLVLDFLKEKNIPAFTQSNVLLENKASVRLVLEYAKYCIFGDVFYAHFIKNLTGKTPVKLKLDLSKSAVENVLYLIKILELDLADLALLQFLEYAQSKENFLELLFEPCTLKIVSEQSFGISIMSVHKSKGLEFENVILLDSLSKHNTNSDSILLEYDIFSGWELRIKNDKMLKNDAKYIEFKEKIQNAEKEDDINKLYVAMTRARNSLIVIKRNKEFVNGNSPSYFNDDSYLNLKEGDFGVLELEPVRLEKNATYNKTSLPSFVKVGLQELESKREQSKEGYFGEAFHYIMQHINFKNRANFSKICQKLEDNFRFLDKDELKDAILRAQRLLNDENFNELLKGKTLLKEQSFSFKNQIKRLDLLALGESENFIIDYKTGELEKEEHKIQVSFYKEAMSGILNKKARAFMVYCLKEQIKIVEV